MTGNGGLSALAGWSWLERLRVLLLHFNGIGDEGVQALARSSRMTALVWLDLMANRITSAGGRAWRAPRRLPNLARLELQRNDIGPDEQQELRERFGDVRGALTRRTSVGQRGGSERVLAICAGLVAGSGCPFPGAGGFPSSGRGRPSEAQISG